MSSNALSVSVLEQASFQLFTESVKIHRSSIRNSVGRTFHVAWPHTVNARRPRTVLVWWLNRYG